MNIFDDQTGRILIRALRSSTCWTVHSLHGFAIEPSSPKSSSVFKAARFRSLDSGHKFETSTKQRMKL